jgi:hypothetical protein
MHVVATQYAADRSNVFVCTLLLTLPCMQSEFTDIIEKTTAAVPMNWFAKKFTQYLVKRELKVTLFSLVICN